MIWSLQALRFVAASLVVFLHSAQVAVIVTGSSGTLPPRLVVLGQSGVDIFFVLSGVVIALSAQGLSASEFAWRRFRRIVPFYLACSIPAFLIAAKTGFGWRDVLATVLLWPATDVMTGPLVAVAWTLCFEMLFYAAAALVLLDRRWLYALLVLYAVAWGLRPYGPVFQFLGNPIIIEFLLGVVISRLPLWRPAAFAIPLGFAALVVASFNITPEGNATLFLEGRHNVERVLFFGLPAALIVYGVMQIKMGENVWTYLGGASYALYLVHDMAASALVSFWRLLPLPPDAILILTMLACVVAGWRVHELIEKPILNFFRHRGNGLRFRGSTRS
jgi:exopolysaccharide production protein ExoZ